MNSTVVACEKNVNLSDKQGLGQQIKDIMAGTKYGKAKIKLEIDISEHDNVTMREVNKKFCCINLLLFVF